MPPKDDGFIIAETFSINHIPAVVFTQPLVVFSIYRVETAQIYQNNGLESRHLFVVRFQDR